MFFNLYYYLHFNFSVLLPHSSSYLLFSVVHIRSECEESSLINSGLCLILCRVQCLHYAIYPSFVVDCFGFVPISEWYCFLWILLQGGNHTMWLNHSIHCCLMKFNTVVMIVCFLISSLLLSYFSLLTTHISYWHCIKF